jgi:hypothetical protein
VRARVQSDEAYIIDLCDQVLGETALRQHRLPFLLGDPDRRGTRRRLPIDAFYPRLNLAIEYHELQHWRATALFDKPGRLTVSGVHRGEQRRLYDQRRQTILSSRGIDLVVLRCICFPMKRRKLKRDPVGDLEIVRAAVRPWLPTVQGQVARDYCAFSK